MHCSQNMLGEFSRTRNLYLHVFSKEDISQKDHYWKPLWDPNHHGDGEAFFMVEIYYALTLSGKLDWVPRLTLLLILGYQIYLNQDQYCQ
ncbi:hypothetical protein LINPERHAP2_LOCUS3227 [Linum perenne]